MRTHLFEIVLAGLLVGGAPAFAAAPKAPFDTAKTEDLTGAKGAFNEKESVFKCLKAALDTQKK